MKGRGAGTAGVRLLRVAELLSADTAAVTARAAALPEGITAAVAELQVGTLLTLELRRHWWDRRPRRVALAGLERQLRAIEADTAHVVIVAAALIVDHTVLVAQRNHPAELAGQWEFPGGKVERGETARDGLARECAEELGCAVTVGPELARTVLPDEAVLVLFEVSLADGSAAPQALEHREVRWVRANELAGLDWVATNHQFVHDVTHRL